MKIVCYVKDMTLVPINILYTNLNRYIIFVGRKSLSLINKETYNFVTTSKLLDYNSMDECFILNY